MLQTPRGTPRSSRASGFLRATGVATWLVSVLFAATVQASVVAQSFSIDPPVPPPTTGPVIQPNIGVVGGGPLTAATDTPTHDATVGTMAGQAGVDGGAATYTVPIEVPPGRAGMQPALSLNYNSRSGNGVMGVGWSVSGSSSIHRCPQTPEQDGQSLGVSYSSTDRLCLDGQRLIPVAGSNGASGTEYRTEVDSYARIYQVGGGLTGNSTCFRVEQKDGRILHYGGVVSGTAPSLACAITAAVHSRVLPNPSTPLSWLVEKIEDRVGNNQLYTYQDQGNGEVLLSTVSYTGFGAAVGDRSVTFTYEARTSAAAGVLDTTSSYLAGSVSMQTLALQYITTQVGTTVARVYQPNYVLAAYSHRLLMDSMQECAGSGCSGAQVGCTPSATTACHPATTFEYNDSALQYPLTSLGVINFAMTGSLNALNPYTLSTIADLDGDGTRETIANVYESDGVHTFLVQMTGDRIPHDPVDITSAGLQGTSAGYADIDGDGRSEVIEIPPVGSSATTLSFGVWNLPRGQVATSNPFTTVASNIAFVPGQSSNVYAADMNGDGKVDIVVVGPSGSCVNAVFVWLNTLPAGTLSTTTTANFTLANNGAPLFCLPRTVNSANSSLYDTVQIDHIADFDGNGLPDFYLVYAPGTTLGGTLAGVALTQGSGTTLSVTTLNCSASGTTFLSTDECSNNNGYFTRWLDINGDGLEETLSLPGRVDSGKCA